MTENNRMVDQESRSKLVNASDKLLAWGKSLGFVLVLLAGLILFVPWCPIISTWYYEYCIHLATAEGWQFGTDIIATYGPLGYIGLPFYHNSTYPNMILLNICLYGIMVAFLWDFWQRTINVTRPSAIWILIILLLPGFGPAAEWSPVLFIPYILLNLFILRYFMGSSTTSYVYLALLFFVLGIFVLVKGTFILLILLAIVVVAVDQVIYSKRIPWIVPSFIISVLILWVLSNQKVGHILDYFFSTADLIAGYKDGMSNDKCSELEILPIIFAAGSLAFVMTFFMTIKKHLAWRSILPTIILSATLFVIYQHGFLGKDPQHSVPACLSFCNLFALVLPLLWRQSTGNKILRLAVLVNGFSGIIIVFTCWLSGCGTPVFKVMVQRINRLPILMTQGVSALDEARDNHMQLLKQKYPLPQFNGSVESSTFDSGLTEAYGYHSTARPTIVSYVAYSPKMSKHNKTYLEDSSGPTIILFNTQMAIHGYPSATDPLGLLAQKKHFSAIGRVGSILVLERRADPLKLQIKKLREVDVCIKETILVPDPGKGMIFAHIEIMPTFAGKLFNILYKPALTFITVGVNGKEIKYRLTRSTGKGGIILSPFLCDLPTLQDFYTDSVPSLKLSYFRIECEKGREWCYQDRIRIMLSQIDTE